MKGDPFPFSPTKLFFSLNILKLTIGGPQVLPFDVACQHCPASTVHVSPLSLCFFFFLLFLPFLKSIQLFEIGFANYCFSRIYTFHTLEFLVSFQSFVWFFFLKLKFTDQNITNKSWIIAMNTAEIRKISIPWVHGSFYNWNFHWSTYICICMVFSNRMRLRELWDQTNATFSFYNMLQQQNSNLTRSLSSLFSNCVS